MSGFPPKAEIGGQFMSTRPNHGASHHQALRINVMTLIAKRSKRRQSELRYLIVVPYLMMNLRCDLEYASLQTPLAKRMCL
jgi:hypothetical protein